MDKKRISLYILLVTIAVIAAAVFYYFFAGPDVGRQGAEKVVQTIALEKKEVEVPVYLYFADQGGAVLVPEKRIIRAADDPVSLARKVVAALIQGPMKKTLLPTLPYRTVCRGLYITGEGVAYIDFSPEITDSHPGGSMAEQLSIYSIVNSLVMNVDEVKKVQVLINGREVETLAGHIDLRFPFTANMHIVR